MSLSLRGRVRIVLYRADGESHERRVPLRLLEGLRERLFQVGGAAARMKWEQLGQLSTDAFRSIWPDSLGFPAAIYLRAGRPNGRGLSLQIDLPNTPSLEEFADDVVRFLEGARPLLRIDAEVSEVGEREAAQRFRHPYQQVAGADSGLAGADAAEAGTEPATGTDDSLSQPPLPPLEELVADVEPEVEVLLPGQRKARDTVTGRRWQLQDQDAFELVGEHHPADVQDHELEILPEDLAWLNPGDRIYSAHRGRCRIKRVEDESRQVVVRNTRGERSVISFDELLDEFRFDDGELR